LPAYAPTSIPSSTTANSGFVQVIFLPPKSNSGRPRQALPAVQCMRCATRPGIGLAPELILPAIVTTRDRAAPAALRCRSRVISPTVG
jgi:hypothetical protein